MERILSYEEFDREFEIVNGLELNALGIPCSCITGLIWRRLGHDAMLRVLAENPSWGVISRYVRPLEQEEEGRPSENQYLPDADRYYLYKSGPEELVKINLDPDWRTFSEDDQRRMAEIFQFLMSRVGYDRD